MLSDINKTQSNNSYSGILLPVLGIGGALGIAWFGYKAWDKKREEKEIAKAQAGTLKSTLDLKKRQENINRIETTKGFFTGVTASSPKKAVTVNIFDSVKDLINAFYIKLTDKNGLDHYIKRSQDKIDQGKVRSVYYNMPLNNIARLNKLYNIYTSKSFKEDSQQLDRNLQAEIGAINSTAYKLFPAQIK